MNDRTCQTVRDRLPLHVEGDLAPSETRAVSLHLEGCASCRDVAAALRESQAFLRSAPPAPFDEAERADLRRSVLARLPERPLERSSPLAWLLRASPALAVLAVVALGALAALLLSPRPAPEAVPIGRRGVAQPLPAPEPVLVVAESAPATSAAATSAPAEAPVPAIASRPLPRPRRRARPAGPEPIALVDVSPENALQIQLQTENPSIRILWMVPKPAPEKAPDQA